MKLFLLIALTFTSLTVLAEEHQKTDDHKELKEACLKEHHDLKDKALDECVAKKAEEAKHKEVKK